jgi:WD40 repeat protein
MKRSLFIAITLFALLVTACTPPPLIPPASPSLTAAPLPSSTPQPSTTPLPSNTPLPSATPTPAASVFACAPVAFLPAGDRILGLSGPEVQIFDLATMAEIDLFMAPSNVTAVALSPDGKTLAWAWGDNTIQLVRLSDHQVLHTLAGHTDQVTKLKFTPDGTRLVSASHDTWVRVWDMDGKEIGAFQPTGALDWPSRVMGAGISPDGKLLATAPEDGPVKLWNLATFTKVAELGGTGAYDTSDVAFSPDGQFVAADLATGLFLWKAADGRALLDNNSQINSMAFAFSPDGRFLAYANLYDVVLSSPDGAQVIRTLEGHTSPVWSLVFSPDSSKLVTSDGVEVRIWQVPDGTLLYTGKSYCP